MAKRIAKIVGGVLALLLAGSAYLAWYVTSLPWRNSCAEAPRQFGPADAAAAVATSQPAATRAAADVLGKGGNAVDAAVTAALVLGVVEPGNSGLGGGGFALVHDPAKVTTTSLDFREQAPAALDVAALEAAARADPNVLRNGALAVAVPAQWDGLTELHRRHGSMPLADLVAPAIRAAREGTTINTEYAARCWVRLKPLRANEDARRIFLASTGLCPTTGSMLVQPELAQTLEQLAAGKPWNDVVGRKMVDYLRGLGSPIAAADLERPHVVERPVVSGTFRGHRVVSMAPPSSGGIIVVALLQAYERARTRLPEANRLHLWTELSRALFADRAALLGDPDHVKVPTERLVSAAYADELAARLRADAPLDLPTSVPPAGPESQHTTHLSVVDSNGMAVSMTMTINVPFGSGLVVPGTGVLLNNEMDDFFLERPNAFDLVGNANNAPAPGKRPLSSMAPTIVFEGDRVKMVLGSPGGSTIPGAVAQVIRNVLEDGMDADTAVRSGRIHHQWLPDRLQAEPHFDRAQLAEPARTKASKPMFPLGRVQMVMRNASGWQGVSDCRDQGEPWSGTPPRRQQ